MTKAQAKKLKVGDRVTWKNDDDIFYTTTQGILASEGEIVETGYNRFKVKWGDGVVAQYLNDFVPQLKCINVLT